MVNNVYVDPIIEILTDPARITREYAAIVFSCSPLSLGYSRCDA